MNDVENTILKNRIKALEDKLARIESIRLIPQTATLSQVIDILNKVTDSQKRRR